MHGSGGRDEDSARPIVGKQASGLANVLLLFISILTSLAVIESACRLALGLPVFKLANWRTERVVMVDLDEFKAVPDSVLGWTNRAWHHHEDGYTTIDFGVRRNFDETTIRTGGILAVGNSFTEGWEVEDHESWPAVLEQMSGVPVVNAGVGGYGSDQIIMRAEQLLPIVKPKILIVGMLESDIFRAGHSIFGAPKPYFTIQNGKLVHHPPEPIEPPVQGGAWSTIAYTLRDGLGYLASVDYILARLNPNYWYGTGSRVHYRKVDVDEAEVTCALLRRLKAQTDREGIHTLLFMQYYAPIVLASDSPPRNAQHVLQCAEQAGIRLLDQFAFLRRLAVADPHAMKEHYVHYGETYGHMSATGNRHAAQLLFHALADRLEGLPLRRQALPVGASTAPH